MSGKLKCSWSKREKDHMIHYPRGCDGHLLHQLISSQRPTIDFDRISDGRDNLFPIRYEKSFLEELEIRGYDVKTLKISCELKQKKGAET